MLTTLIACFALLSTLVLALDSRRRATKQQIEWLEKQLNASRDNTTYELSGAAQILLANPLRKQLVSETIGRMDVIHEKLDPILFPGMLPVSEHDSMWKLREKDFPYSITPEEGLLLYHMIKSNNLKRGFEVATAFGYSSFYMGQAFAKTGGHLVSMDAYLEEEKEDFMYSAEEVEAHVADLKETLKTAAANAPFGLRFATTGAKDLGIDQHVDYVVGASPGDIASVVGDQQLDFAFIDGGHHNGQPQIDVRAVAPLMDPDRFLMVFHDAQAPDVAEAAFLAREILQAEFTLQKTRNHVIFVHRGLSDRSIVEAASIPCRQYEAFLSLGGRL